jgi:hypothetical protein
MTVTPFHPRNGITEDGNAKICNKCGEVKPLTAKYWVRSNWTAYGFATPCKECRKMAQQQRVADPVQHEIKKAKARVYSNERYAADPEFFTEKARLWREANPETVKATQKRRFRAFERYGLTLETYTSMLEAQGGVCAIEGCNRTNGAKRMHVDHDHECCPTGRSCGKCVRGLLCQNCNRAIGQMSNDPNIVLGIAEYLLDWEDR